VSAATKKKRWGFVKRFVKYLAETGKCDLPRNLHSSLLTFKVSEQQVKTWTPAEVRQALAGLPEQFRLHALLGLNCGFGNSDVGTLPLAALDLEGGWAAYHRPKTGISRRCPLWPETVEALKAAIAKRPTPKTAEAEPLVFVTKYGAPWAKETFDNPVTKEFRKLLDDLGLHKAGLGFYTLRHVFRTIADESRDQPAVNSIMGHADASMAAAYRERIADDRLKAVADYVHGWLYAKAPEQADEPAKAKPKRAPAKSAASKAAGKRQRQTAEPAATGHLLRIVG
jgi:integrase